MLLRIEDIDHARCRPEFEAALREDLRWLGLAWEEPVRRQSERLDVYAAAVETLIARGVVYRCFRSRKEQLAAIASAPHDAPPASSIGPHPAKEEAARLAAGEPYAWRLSLDAAMRAIGGTRLDFEETGEGPKGERGPVPIQPEVLGDVIVARKDLGVSYHLAVVIDDAAQAVTCVTRGRDLFEATHVQRLLQALLELPTPAYHHHRLILRADGVRFAKRDTAETLRSVRESGVTPAELRRELGF